jgi:hypothetical protein
LFTFMEISSTILFMSLNGTGRTENFSIVYIHKIFLHFVFFHLFEMNWDKPWPFYFVCIHHIFMHCQFVDALHCGLSCMDL